MPGLGLKVLVVAVRTFLVSNEKIFTLPAVIMDRELVEAPHLDTHWQISPVAVSPH